MPTVIALHWNETELQFVAAGGAQVEAVSSVTLEPGMAATSIGKRLATALVPHVQGRTKVVVALGRTDLEWQHLSLPPCPADELPDVVRLQADRDLSPSDEDLGFDYLALLGDEQTPHQVLTVTLGAAQLEKIRQVCQAANLTLERIVPLATGWPAITKQAFPGIEPGTQIFAAPLANEATLWATRGGKVVLFRQFQLAVHDDPASLASTVGSELRRTLLALSQHEDNGNPTVSLVGQQQDRLGELAKNLNDQLDVSVQSQDVAAHFLKVAKNAVEISALPLVGLAVDEALGNKPLVDLLHPHRRPQTQINVRTYALAAAAGVLFLALFGWLSYAKLQAPLNQAAADQAELTLLEESLDELSKHERRAASIRDWHSESPNLLLHFQQFSKSIRPKALASKEFSAEQDVVLEKLTFEKRQFTIDAMARSSQAVQPLEARLRDSGYRPQRGKSVPSKTVEDYSWNFKSTIEITEASDRVDPSVGETPTAEPQS